MSVELRTAAPKRSIARSIWLRLNLVDRMLIGYVVALGILIAAFRSRVPEWRTDLTAHLLIVLLIVALGAVWGRGTRFLHDWYPLAVFIGLFKEAARLAHVVVPHWQDEYLLRFEAWLFPVPPTTWLGQFARPWLTELLEFGYFSYYLLLLIVGGVLYRRANRTAFLKLMSASVLAYLVCYVIFILFPTEGPRYTLGTVQLTGGPFHWAVLTLQSNAGVHGNAFPSAHVANAIICVIMALVYVRRLGIALVPVVFLLSVGAVYDGYHYLSDVLGGAVLGAVVAAFILKLPDSSIRS